MCGKTLITHQTGATGRPCNAVYIVERVYIRKEHYVAFLLDRGAGALTLVVSEKGGNVILFLDH